MVLKKRFLHNPFILLTLAILASLFYHHYSYAQLKPPVDDITNQEKKQEKPVSIFHLGGSADAISRAGSALNYRLDAGDVLDITISGRLELNKYSVVVSTDGFIHIPSIERVQVRGFMVPEVREKILKQFSIYYKYIDVLVSLVKPRIFEVMVTGEAEKPGSYSSSALDRVSHILALAGGVTPRGSLRNIEIYQLGKKLLVLDMYKFAYKGDESQNPFLREGLVIHIPVKDFSINVQGQVVRPGDYELTDDKSLNELIKLAGGFTPFAATREVKIVRIMESGAKESISVNAEEIIKESKASPAVILKRGDTVFVQGISILQDFVDVRGAVYGVGASAVDLTKGGTPLSQGRYELVKGETIRDIIIKAGWIAPYADLNKAYIERKADNLQRVTTIPVDLRKILIEKDLSQNIEMKNGDVMIIPAMESKVYVTGFVKTPQAVDYQPNWKLSDYVGVAGGVDVRGQFKNTIITKKDGTIVSIKGNPMVDPGSTIYVPEVNVKWWQDYLTIATGVASIILSWWSVFQLK